MSRSVDPVADMERAEDLFHSYGIPFDQQVLAVHRLHILRRFGRALAAQSAACAGDPLALAEALAEAHAYFAAGGATETVPSRHPGTPLVQLRRAPGRNGSRA